MINPAFYRTTVNNNVVLTSVTLNTLYDYPDPEVLSNHKHNCTNYGRSYDFEYTGHTSDSAHYSWTFTDGTPSTSSIQNPTGIVFSSTGYKLYTLTITRNGCESTSTDSILVTNEVNSGDSLYVCYGSETEYIALSQLSTYLANGFCVGACINPTRMAFAINEDHLNVTASPNPTKEDCLLKIEGSIHDNQVIILNLFNYSGSLIRTKELKPQILETHSDDFKLNYLLNTKDLTAGLYFIKVSYGSNQKLIKLVIL